MKYQLTSSRGKVFIRNLALALFSVIFVSSVLLSQETLSPVAEKLKQHVMFLASDELEGRYPGTDGMRQAREYIVTNFKKAGLKNQKENINTLRIAKDPIDTITRVVIISSSSKI